MQKILIILIVYLLSSFCLNQSVAFCKKPKSYDNHESQIIDNSRTPYRTTCTPIKDGISKCITTDPTFTEFIPNPVVYWYGTGTNDEPILLLNFKSGIPIKCLVGNLITEISAIILKLKLPEQYGYYFKILEIYGRPEYQTINYKMERSSKTIAQPSYKEIKAGSVEFNNKRSMDFQAKHPVITFYGVSSDTLTIMLRRGRKYPIPNCQIQVSMLVRAMKKTACDKRKAIDFYKLATTHSCDLQFHKSVVQVTKKPLFVKKLPFIAKIFVVPIVKLFYPNKNYDTKVIKANKESIFSSRIIIGSHIFGCFKSNQNNIIDFNTGAFRDDDVLYKEMELPYKIDEKATNYTLDKVKDAIKTLNRVNKNTLIK